MIVRLAKVSDKEAIFMLLEELQEEVNKRYNVQHTVDKKAPTKLFEKILQRDDTKLFVVENGKETVACATLHILPLLRHGEFRGWVDGFTVTKSKRRKGIGTLLLDEIKQYCSRNKINVIRLTSANELPRSRAARYQTTS